MSLCKYNIIHFRGDKESIVTKKKYVNWIQIQEEYDDYLTSLSFDSIIEIENYLQLEYKLGKESLRSIVNSIIEGNEIVELKF